ncbi:MAG: transcriptional regulator [Bacteroidetes bacterium 4572_117]|nr:MAG: transcriptional regulator [Bacteroidetes bacterium 4572_117]
MEKNLHIDVLDRKILSILVKSAKTPFLEVAKLCKVSGSAIHQRVNKLIEMGVITGSHFSIDHKKLGYQTTAYVGVYLENALMFADVLAEMKKIPEIIQCHYTTGQYSMFIKIVAKENTHLKQILSEKLVAVRGVLRTETFMSLDALIDREVPIEI